MKTQLCPLTKQECYKDRCAMWIPLPDDAGTCSIKQIAIELFVIADVMLKTHGLEIKNE